MFERKAVRKIVEFHVSAYNYNEQLALKLFLYAIAISLFLILSYNGRLIAGMWTGGIIAVLTMICVGLPRWLSYEDLLHERVPDDVYLAIKNSRSIEPQLLDCIRSARNPHLTVRELVSVEVEYHRVKKITSAPGYRSLDLKEAEAI